MREQKITLGEMRSPGVRGLLVYADYQRAHSGGISADRWPDHIRLSDLEPLFVCQACGRRGADIRPDWDLGHAAKGLPHPIGARALRATLRTRRRAFCALPLTRAPPRVAPSETA
jgi:hypothetical protein